MSASAIDVRSCTPITTIPTVVVPPSPTRLSGGLNDAVVGPEAARAGAAPRPGSGSILAGACRGAGEAAGGAGEAAGDGDGSGTSGPGAGVGTTSGSRAGNGVGTAVGADGGVAAGVRTASRSGIDGDTVPGGRPVAGPGGGAGDAATGEGAGSLLTLDGQPVGAERGLESGRVRARFQRTSGTAGSGVVASVTFRGLKAGSSILRVESLNLTTGGRSATLVVTPARITVSQ